MSKKFSVIVCDMPWKFSDKLTMSDVKRGANSNYSTMTLSEIKSLPIGELADPNGCLLAMWCPSSLIKEGIDIMESYNFNFKQTYIWVKTKKQPLEVLIREVKNIVKVQDLKSLKNKLVTACKTFMVSDSLSFFMGRLFRQTHEICLIGTSNNGIYKSLKNKSQRSVCFAENLKHSTKPPNLQESLEIMFPNQNYLEIFGRRSRSNWTVIGNESPETFNEDIRDSINNLLK